MQICRESVRGNVYSRVCLQAPQSVNYISFKNSLNKAVKQFSASSNLLFLIDVERIDMS